MCRPDGRGWSDGSVKPDEVGTTPYRASCPSPTSLLHLHFLLLGIKHPAIATNNKQPRNFIQTCSEVASQELAHVASPKLLAGWYSRTCHAGNAATNSRQPNAEPCRRRLGVRSMLTKAKKAGGNLPGIHSKWVQREEGQEVQELPRPGPRQRLSRLASGTCVSFGLRPRTAGR